MQPSPVTRPGYQGGSPEADNGKSFPIPVSSAQEANVAKALGFVEASELDGGGSTTALVRRTDGNWDRVDDKDSIWQRPVPNALIWVKPKR